MKRVLVADDDLSLRTVIAKGLGIAGYFVSTASDGLEAVERAATEQFDAVVLDVNMPNVDGFDAHGAIRSAKPSLPVIVMSADAENDERARALGARRFVLKRGEFLDLLTDALDTILERRPASGFSS